MLLNDNTHLLWKLVVKKTAIMKFRFKMKWNLLPATERLWSERKHNLWGQDWRGELKNLFFNQQHGSEICCIYNCWIFGNCSVLTLKVFQHTCGVLYCSVSEPPDRGPVPGPGIKYTEPREILLEFVILVFQAIIMNKYFIVEILWGEKYSWMCRKAQTQNT